MELTYVDKRIKGDQRNDDGLLQANNTMSLVKFGNVPGNVLGSC